jgi:hypothetical protein
VTVWFSGANWNWTISPTAATTEFGVYSNVPFGFPTLTTCTVMLPEDVDDAAEEVAEAAE